MADSAMEPSKTHLLWWLSSLYPQPRECSYVPDGVVSGNQLAHPGDTFSCGIIACNAIAHELFGDDLWKPANSKQIRIDVFKRIVLYHNERVSGNFHGEM